MIKNPLKYSGIFWFGNIPEDWVIRRIKDLTYTKSGTTPATNILDYYENGKYNWIRTTDLNNSELYDTEYKVTDLAIQKCRLTFLPIDTVLIAMYGGFGTIGKNAILKKPSTINQSVCAILPNAKHIDSNYLMYFFKYFRNDWQLFADGARKDPNINQDAVKNLFVIYPPLTEQTAIATYLDSKTSVIDRKVTLLEQKITHYQQLRKSLINETVCRGLDKNVKLKDSGVGWIGRIPEHWEVKRLKDFYQSSMGNTILQEDLIENGKIPVYSATEVDKYFGFVNSANKILKMNDLVIPARGNSIGFVKLVREKCTSTQTTISCKKTGNIDTKYVYFYLSGNKKVIFKFDDTAIPQFTVEDANYITLLNPPKEEQGQIANFLDEKTQKIDSIVSNIKTQIQTLKELRKTLINDVVTGKIKVTEQ